MRLHDQHLFMLGTPAAAVSGAVFHKIDWPINLAGPTTGGDTPPRLVD
jgi:hypothetical protein